jgi:hypothetical protein
LSRSFGYRLGTIALICHIEKDACASLPKSLKYRCRVKGTVQIVLLGTRFDNLKARDFVPLMRKCNQKVTIILVSDDESLPSIRKLREEGIFYHALIPVNHDDWKEIRQAVDCAFSASSRSSKPPRHPQANYFAWRLSTA